MRYTQVSSIVAPKSITEVFNGIAGSLGGSLTRAILITGAFFSAGLCARADQVVNVVGTFAGASFRSTASPDASQTAFSAVSVVVTSLDGSSFTLAGAGKPDQLLNENDIYSTGLGQGVYGPLLDLSFYLPAASVNDFTGASLCSVSNTCPDGAESTYFARTPVDRQSYPVLLGSIDGVSAAASPEPSTCILLATGLLAATAESIVLRRKRRGDSDTSKGWKAR